MHNRITLKHRGTTWQHGTAASQKPEPKSRGNQVKGGDCSSKEQTNLCNPQHCKRNKTRSTPPTSAGRVQAKSVLTLAG
jgi:hypothetical protein